MKKGNDRTTKGSSPYDLNALSRERAKRTAQSKKSSRYDSPYDLNRSGGIIAMQQHQAKSE